ncbi:MAG: ATPase domain-containing protein [Candidatus Hydrothermarchaeota archaeon]
MEKVNTGIKGFDEILGGGLPRESNILIVGGPGTGKTMFCLQYLYKGAYDYNEPGIYISLEEREKDLKRNVESFGWDLDSLINQGKLEIMDVSTTLVDEYEGSDISLRVIDIGSLINIIFERVKSLKAQRVAIDSIPTLFLQYDNLSSVRNNIFRLCNLLLTIGCTTLLCSQAGIGQIGKFGIEEYIAQGVIVLNLQRSGDKLVRSLYVRKMRGCDHSMYVHPFEITPEEGIVLEKIIR